MEDQNSPAPGFEADDYVKLAGQLTIGVVLEYTPDGGVVVDWGFYITVEKQSELESAEW